MPHSIRSLRIATGKLLAAALLTAVTAGASNARNARNGRNEARLVDAVRRNDPVTVEALLAAGTPADVQLIFWRAKSPAGTAAALIMAGTPPDAQVMCWRSKTPDTSGDEDIYTAGPPTLTRPEPMTALEFNLFAAHMRRSSIPSGSGPWQQFRKRAERDPELLWYVNNQRISEDLIRAGARVTPRPGERSPLELALDPQCAYIPHLLIARGAGSQPDERREPILAYGAAFLDIGDIRMLLAYGCQADPWGSILSYVVGAQHWDVALLLLHHGASPTTLVPGNEPLLNLALRERRLVSPGSKDWRCSLRVVRALKRASSNGARVALTHSLAGTGSAARSPKLRLG